MVALRCRDTSITAAPKPGTQRVPALFSTFIDKDFDFEILPSEFHQCIQPCISAKITLLEMFAQEYSSINRYVLISFVLGTENQ